MVVTILPDWVIKHFDVIEYIAPSLLAFDIDPSAYSLLLEQLEETLATALSWQLPRRPWPATRLQESMASQS